MRMLLVRHGDTQRSQNGAYGYSALLTELGRMQAERVSHALADLGVTQVVSSDAVRAAQTAEPLEQLLGVQKTLIGELKEIDIGGPSDGITPLVENITPDGRYIMDCAHLGGESWDVFSARVLSGLEILADRFAGDDVIAVFTHGGVKSVALDHFSGRELSRTMHMQYGNGSISTVDAHDSGYVIHSINDVRHLRSIGRC